MPVEKAAVKSEKERKGTARSVRMIKPRGVEGKEGGGGRRGKGKLSSSSCAHGRKDSHGLEIPVYRIHQNEMKWKCGKGPEIA